MTNYEAIKAMDQHELAEFLASFMPCSDCLVSEEPLCRSRHLYRGNFGLAKRRIRL